jgi:tetratricopeptide (TPR) repeat protein
MEKIQNRFEQNFIYEFEMFDFYNFLYIQDESFQKYFDNWVKLFPDNWQSRIARANYFYAMGWKSRGHKYARDTSPEQFRMMERYFDQSLKDIVRALQLNKKLLYAYSIYIGIQKNYSNDAYNIDAIDQVLTMYPESYKIREIFMTDLFPRWGGSHKKMFSFAKESEKYSSKNPLLRVLMGYIYYDKGRYAEEGENFKLAEECYCNALKFGECWNFLNLRASLYYYNLDNPEKALIDVNRCLQIEPYNVSSLSLRAKIFFGLNKEKEALNDIQTAQQIKDNDESITRLKKWASQHM